MYLAKLERRKKGLSIDLRRDLFQGTRGSSIKAYSLTAISDIFISSLQLFLLRHHRKSIIFNTGATEL